MSKIILNNNEIAYMDMIIIDITAKLALKINRKWTVGKDDVYIKKIKKISF